MVHKYSKINIKINYIKILDELKHMKASSVTTPLVW